VVLAVRPQIGLLLTILLIPYIAAVLVQAAVLAQRGKLQHVLGSIPLIVMTHILYGYGFWRGLFTRLSPSGAKPKTDVVIEKIR
jgi:uncharacterized membrane protein